MREIANKRVISLVLALALCLQLLPATLVTAAETDESPETTTETTVETVPEESTEETVSEAMVVAVPETTAETVPETTAETVPETTAETVPETTAETVPETTAETVPETTAETVPETTAETVPETTEETVPETTEELVEEEPDPWEIIEACGGLKTPYAFGPGITYTLPALLSEEGDASTFAARANTIDSLELLKSLLNGYHKSTNAIEWSDNKLISMPLDAGEQLILLTATDPQVYQQTAFSPGSITGAISLTGSVKYTVDGTENSLTFQGLGSAVYPFQGSFANSSFTANYTLFNALDYSTAQFSENSLTIDWLEPNNSKGAIVATEMICAPDTNKQLTVAINSSKYYSFRDAAFGKISGNLGLTISFSNSSAFENKSSSANAGLVANTVTGGTLSLTVNSFPSSITIGVSGTDDANSNAGLLVGYLEDASLALTLGDAITPPSAIIQAPKGSAGGIVGRIDSSTVSTVSLNINMALTAVTILGKYTGGVAGYAKNVAFGVFGENKFSLPKSLGVKANNIVGSGDVSSQYTGGIFGWYDCGNGAYSSFDGSGFSFPDSIELHVNAASGEAGALFGRLTLGGCSFTVAGTSESPLNISSKIVIADTTVAQTGGLVGKLSGASKANTLIIQNAKISVPEVTTSKVQYLGGLVGSVEKASVSVTDVTVTVPQPSAATYFGGLVASLGDNCVLKTEKTVSVSTDATAIVKGGGLVGEAKSRSVVRLSGITDLSNVAYTAGNTVGQLVANQDSALIFATGSGNGGENNTWTYQRSTAKARVDDIGNYGQVIRLGGNLSHDLISINTDNSISFKNHGSYGTIGSADDFALHAIAFTTNDAFGLYSNSPPIKKSSVTLTGNIDLSGTGIQGLTRDNGSDQWDGSTNKDESNKGIGVTFDGRKNTLTINTGEVYGKRRDDMASGEGSGQCYRHGYYGLMGKVNSAIVKELTIKSTMNIGADVTTYAGAVFGYVSGGHSETGSVNTLDTVTLSADSKINLDGTPPANTYSHVGGLIGYVAGDETGVTVNDSFMLGNIAYTGSSDSVMLGGILGKDNYAASIDLQFENVTVGGTISTSTTNNAHVGGLVADICAKDTTYRDKNGATMTLKKVVVSSAISTSANTASGGLLGYYWDNVDVTFDGSGENAPYAVTTDGASLTASGGAATGGLCFAATGRWNMQGKAVDMGSASISNGSGALGLLVCHGERQGSKPGAYTNGENAKALYLVMDTEWDTAYHNKDVVISNSSAVFDEIVAYTARSDKAAANPVYDITRNDAGIISLHTTADKVNMTIGERNTYVNRTTYGTTKQTNPYSRYYYNLDRMRNPAPADVVDTEAELLIWSVRKYCAENIRGYLPVISSNTITGILDMDGYSYYPVNVGNTDVTISNATITFHNQDIESKEKTDPKNKSTLASDAASRTQHFTMHSGLLLDYYADSSAKKAATLTVNKLTLLGTVGMVGSGSGALICGKIYGYDGTKSVKLELNTLKVDSEENHLSVASFNVNYAPLLINSVGSYAALNLTGVTANEASAGATSLMGDVGKEGDEQAKSTTLTLSQIKLPDKKGRFTKATMLNSLYYDQNSSATYNFTKEEDWDGQNHIYNVTYGKEIGGTVEYAESVSNPHQYHYAQSNENVSYSGSKFEVEERDSFDGYLPYVAQAYDAENGYHEIQVNSSLEDINTGCGTYCDPYRISKESELQSIAIYLATGVASNGWTLNIPSNDGNGNSAFCDGNTSKTHKTYTYRGGNWIEQQNTQTAAEGGEASGPVTLTNATVRAYLNNAYYQIKKDIEVSNFTGFGTQADPFRGVIVGTDVQEENSSNTRPATITLKGTLPQGFIVYSYGSVVKNLKLDVQGAVTVSFAEIKNNQGYTSESFFGGVIGCILGGDNIIESVDVTYNTGGNVTLGETRPWLVPVGGYVGVISGGSVIFRGENGKTNEACEEVKDPNYFYANRYVGRVIQGFAVQEGDGTKLNYSEKNYQICWLDKDKTTDIIVDPDRTITLKDAQALLVFSSVTNSGGAGGGKVLPYFSNARTCWNGTDFGATSVGGKVRNASYNGVGTVTDQNDADYRMSLADDYAAVSATNASYLDTHYAGGNLFAVCNTSTKGYTLNLSGVTYDMTAYGNGYRSISPRYLANAVCNNAETSSVNYQYLNPLISGFNGNGARIKTNIVSKEYVDDDHHAIAVGGIFNTLRFTTGATMKDVTIGGAEGDNNKGTISHEYYEWTDGSCADATYKNWNGTPGFTNLTYPQGRGLIGIGGFAGNNVMSSGDKIITFENVNTDQLKIKGPFDAGGIIGHTGMRVTGSISAESKNYEIFYLTDTQTSHVIPTFINCSYKNIQIDGGMLVGGYVGYVAYGMAEPINGGRYDKTVKVTFTEKSDGVLGLNASIICQRAKTDNGIDNSPKADGTGKINCLPASGGLFGCSSLAIKVDNTRTAIIRNVTVRSGRSAGGVIAWPLSSVTIRNLSVIGDEGNRTQIGDIMDHGKTAVSESDQVCEFAGGFVGYHEGSSKPMIVENCTAENLLVAGSLRSNSYPSYAAGIAGNIFSSSNHIIGNCMVKNVKLVNSSYTSGTKACPEGGFIGRLQSGNLYGGNLLADSVECVARETGDPVGNLIGQVDSGKIVYLAGVSVQNTEKLSTILQTDIGGTKPDKCYVAYADYNGAAQKPASAEPVQEGTQSTETPSTASSNADKTGSVVADSEAPHVTTSPRGVEIPIGPKDAEGNQEKMYLYGDGANPEVVGTIFDERAKTEQKKFYYGNVKDTENQVFNFNRKYISDFYAEMGLTAETANGIPNFPVLQVPVADKTTVSDQIVDYLNLVTNNGYSTARDTNVGASSHISSSIVLYRWNEAGYFEKDPSGVTPAFSGSGDSFETSFTNYDSGNNQFELLTVMFTEEVTISSVKHSYQYKILVPIVVRRMLEVDFTATLKDSPSFKASDYEVYNDGFKSNITVGYGVSVSALLTYTYNRAIGDPQTFGWQTHLDNGGFMGDPEQTIQFYNPNSKLKSLPKGTQLILLDCANNNKPYRYQVASQSVVKGTQVKLSEFKDTSGNAFDSPWLSEIIQVTAAQAANGEWVLLEGGSSGATARVMTETGYQYFRPKKEGDTDTTKLYHLTAGRDDSGKELQPTEQFYLVIYIPDSCVEGIPETSETEGKNLNGYISASLPGLDQKIAYNINAVRVKQDDTIVTDPHSGSESTYNFLSGYVQSLSDHSEDKNYKQEADPEAYILLSQPGADGNYLLHMDLVDEITVVKGQKDTADKPLFFKADISLPKYAKGETTAVSLVSANGFPTGCYGTAEFYVYLCDNQETKTYYTWNGSSWVSSGSAGTPLSYGWEANGGNMELRLGTANTTDGAVSLAGIRELAKKGNEKFYVETKMNIHMSGPAAEQVIAGSITKGNAYTKLSYTTYLASSRGDFSSTNYVKSAQGEVRYYQSRSGSSTLTHSANDPTQLGINCSDLASANGVIYTTGVYDLATVSNAEKLIKDATRVEYTLTLWQRQESGEYSQVTEGLDRYIRSVRMHDQPVRYGDGYQWSDEKHSGVFASTDPENSKRFLLPIRIQVNTDVEANDVSFANYQLRLTATLCQGSNVLDQPVNDEKQNGEQTEYIRYDYVTYTITRLLTSGYWGQQN